MRKIAILYVCVIGVVLFLTNTTYGAEATKEGTAEGVAVIKQGDSGQARDSAINDALRRVVESIVGTFVQAETIVKNYQLVEDKIYSRTQAYVKKYDVIEEKKDGELYRVKVKAVLTLDTIKDDLSAIGLMQERMHKPRVMVLIEEKIVGESSKVSVSEIKMNEMLMGKGFNVVDAKQVDLIRQKHSAKLAIDGDAKAACSIALDAGAEVIIAGTATVMDAGKVAGSDMHSYQADIVTQAIKADNGQVIATGKKHSAKVHIAVVSGACLALEDATVKLSEELIEKILQVWSKELASGKMIQLVVSNVDFAQLKKLEDALKQDIRAVDGVHRRSFANNVALIDIDTKLTPDELAEELTAKDVGVKVEVTGISANKIYLKIK